jgi:hypothetical protein
MKYSANSKIIFRGEYRTRTETDHADLIALAKALNYTPGHLRLKAKHLVAVFLQPVEIVVEKSAWFPPEKPNIAS